MSNIPPTRLLTVGHNNSGTSIIESDTVVKPFQPFGPSATAFSNFHSTPTVPASNTAPLPSIANVLPRCPPSGAIFCTSDLPPNYAAPLHRTESVDYCIVMSGCITLELDGGEKAVVKAGEAIVNRGTNHIWRNKSETEWCRLMFVMLGAEKIVLEDGRVLEETVFGRK